MLSLQAAMVALALTGSGETALYDFYTDWCGPCRAMAPVLHQLAEEGYPVRKVNAEQQPDLAARFKVDCYPTFVMVVDGREVSRHSGELTLTQLKRMFPKPTQERVPVVRGQSPDERGQSLPSRTAPGPLFPGRSSTEDRAAPPAAAAASNRERFLAHLLAVSVRLKIEDPDGFSYGTGTIIDAQGDEALILTCGHVFRDSRGKGRISVDLFGPGAPHGIAGKLISYNLETDVALVRIRTTGRVAAAPVASPDYAASVGDNVVSIGCDHGDPPTPRESRVTNLNKFRGPANLQVAGQPVTGRSGGGLFASDGRVIGVCNAADPEDDEGLYAALPSVYAELDRNGLSAIYERRAPAAAAVAVAETRPVRVEEVDLPAMPRLIPRLREMPAAMRASASTDNATSGESPAREYVEQESFSSEELAVVEELARQTGGAEVICIIPPADGEEGRSEIIVLDRTSPEFRDLLAAARRGPARELAPTSLDVPGKKASTAAARRARLAGRRASPWRAAWRNPTEVAAQPSQAAMR